MSLGQEWVSRKGVTGSDNNICIVVGRKKGTTEKYGLDSALWTGFY